MFSPGKATMINAQHQNESTMEMAVPKKMLVGVSSQG